MLNFVQDGRKNTKEETEVACWNCDEQTGLYGISRDQRRCFSPVDFTVRDAWKYRRRCYLRERRVLEKGSRRNVPVLPTDLKDGIDCRALPYKEATLDCVVFDPP